MKNFILALVFIFLAFLAWQYYSQSDFDFKWSKLSNINLDIVKDINIFQADKQEPEEDLKDYSDLEINEKLSVPKEVVVCLVGAKENLEKAKEESFLKSEELLKETLDNFNTCQKKDEDLEACYQKYLERQEEIVETIKLERVNIDNAYQFNLQLCLPDVSSDDLDLIFNEL